MNFITVISIQFRHKIYKDQAWGIKLHLTPFANFDSEIIKTNEKIALFWKKSKLNKSDFKETWRVYMEDS